MADRDGSARRKKKTKRQTIRVPVDEVPRRPGAGSPGASVFDDAADDAAEADFTPVPDHPEAIEAIEAIDEAPEPVRASRQQKTVVDMQLPAEMLEMFGEPQSGDDTSELSVEVDVSDAERPSVPPPDPGDRPTPPPRPVAALGDDGNRPTPLPRIPTPIVLQAAPPPPPPFGVVAPRATPAPVARPTPPPATPAVPLSPVGVGVVVVSPIRSIGEPIRVVAPEPEPAPKGVPDVPPPLLKMPRFPTQSGIGPAAPLPTEGTDWAGDDGVALPFDGALPGEPGAAPQRAFALDDEDDDVPGAEGPDTDERERSGLDRDTDEDEDDDGDEDEDEDDDDDDGELAREPTQVRRTREDGTPGVVPASPAAKVATPVPPVPAIAAPITDKTPVPAAAAAVLPAEPIDPEFFERESSAPREERDSDPGTPIEDVEAEVLSTPPFAVELPPPPPVARTASGPRMPAVAPPPPPVSGVASLLGVPPPVPTDAKPETVERRRKGKKWWEDFFNEDWLRTIPQVPPETTRKEADFIESSLGVERAAALLDLGCGTGRHAVELASRGYAVVGIDLSLPMLERAQSAAAEREAKVTFQQADMRDLSFESSFDAVYCIGTTFGLFDEDGNLQVIKNAHRALRENGTLLIEVVNRDYVLQAQPNLLWFEGENCVCMEETNVNYITSRLQVKRTVMPDEGGQNETEYSIRLFSLHELGSLLHRHGFRVIEVSGHWATRGVFFGAHSQRLIVLAEKRPPTDAGPPTGTQPSMSAVKSDS